MKGGALFNILQNILLSSLVRARYGVSFVRTNLVRVLPQGSIIALLHLGPVWLDQNQIWILKSGSWNHGVVNKQNVKSESGFLKTNAKSGSSYTPRFNEVERGVYWFHLVRLWTESGLHCIFNNTHRIHFIFAHLNKQLQKVCSV